jgi:prepilin-type N-terminal cleavage/methylation domain-containing protein
VSGSSKGFTLIETAIAMGILGVSLAVLMDGAYLSTAVKSDVRQLTHVTLVARAVMGEIEHKLMRDGFGVFDRSEGCGDFRIKGLRHYACEYTVKKVELPLGDLLQRLMTAGTAGLAQLAGAAAGAAPGSAPPGATPGAPTALGPAGVSGGITATAAAGLGGGLAANAIQLYSAQIESVLEEALREVRLTLTWKTGKKSTESLTVVTHLVEIGRAGVSGLDAAAGQISSQFGLQAPVPGQTPTPGVPFTGTPPPFSPTVETYTGGPRK